MLRLIAILEDNLDRLAEMKRCVANRLQSCEVIAFYEPCEMNAWLEEYLPNVSLISLDHDLELIPGKDGLLRDSGTGRNVADRLAAMEPRCPVVIHSTNRPAALGMEEALTAASWKVARITPYGDLEWISEAWIPTLLQVSSSIASDRCG